jgi:hypothetical protein
MYEVFYIDRLGRYCVEKVFQLCRDAKEFVARHPDGMYGFRNTYSWRTM